jgi:lysophosphatidate acyltransferase
MLNLPYYLLSLRWSMSAAFMLGTAPNYFMVWMMWRLATLPLPSCVYEVGDDFMWGFYQKLILFFFEQCTSLEVSIVQ